MIGGWIRKTGFYIMDILTGGKCIAHLKNLKGCHSDEEINAKMTSILEYAITNVPYYANVGTAVISEFPIVNKTIIKENFDSFISREYSNCSKLHNVQTSGTSGTPTVFYQDTGKRARVKADLIFAHRSIGWNLGDHYVFMRHWVANYSQAKLKHSLQNCYPVNVAGFDDAKKNSLITHLKKHKSTVLFGYTSSIVDFAHYIRENNIDGRSLKIKLVVCDSDELSDSNKRMMADIFYCHVVNRYDNEENGLLAMSGFEDNLLRVNTASLYIELLELNSDQAVHPGEIGRVVVTDLFNKAMPLIRYDTGDLAKSDDEGAIRIIKELDGRNADAIYSSTCNLVSAVAVSVMLEVFHGITRYQLTQLATDKYLLKYSGTLSSDEQDELMIRLYSCLGEDANISIVKLDRLEIERNGKFKTLVGMKQ